MARITTLWYGFRSSPFQQNLICTIRYHKSFVSMITMQCYSILQVLQELMRFYSISVSAEHMLVMVYCILSWAIWGHYFWIFMWKGCYMPSLLSLDHEQNEALNRIFHPHLYMESEQHFPYLFLVEICIDAWRNTDAELIHHWSLSVGCE